MSEQKLNYINYSKHEINMSNFVQATEHNLHMYAKFGDGGGGGGEESWTKLKEPAWGGGALTEKGCQRCHRLRF
jgi:predicted CxxxxCH...CXXCH cytochrome family protein